MGLPITNLQSDLQNPRWSINITLKDNMKKKKITFFQIFKFFPQIRDQRQKPSYTKFAVNRLILKNLVDDESNMVDHLA